MKFSNVVTGLAAATVVSAAPTSTTKSPLIPKRANSSSSAAITDVATTGYATQNGGTTGGQGGTTTTVSTLPEFTAAVTSADPLIVVVSGAITGAEKVRIASNKTIVGDGTADLSGIGLFVRDVSNVIIRNIVSHNVLAANGDAIGIQGSSNVWVDHVELYSDQDHGKDYYDGLLDVTHASEWVTVSNSYLHDHYKASLVGHSDSNGAEDTGHLHVTQHNNYFKNIGSRAPSFRFGTGHIFNSYFETLNTAIDPRDGAQLLVQSNVFSGVGQPLASLYSDDTGYATAIDNDFGNGTNTAPAGTLTADSLPYTYDLLGSANVKASVVGTAGATLSF